MSDASEIQKRLVEAHEAAMKELKDYAVRVREYLSRGRGWRK